MNLLFKKKYLSKKIAPYVLLGLFLATLISPPVFADTNPQEQLELELKQVEDQIAAFEKELSTTKTQKQKLSKKINELKLQQSTLKAQIKAMNLKITRLTGQITVTEHSIQEKTNRLNTLTKEIQNVLRLLNRADQSEFLTLLSSESLADAFVDLQNYEQLSIGLKKLIDTTKKTKKELETQKEAYATAKEEAGHLLSIKTIQQKELVERTQEQATLLEETKGKEQTYQSLLADQKQRAKEIKNRLYELIGGGKQITFGEAVTIADWVAKQTGVRTSFLLAILTQESNLGKNVGTCNRRGDPPEKSWKVVMKPERDQVPFAAITSDLGLDPDITPVSCPMKDKKGNQLGWGGAMGPAQFIPSTWMGYKNKVTALTGKTFANPFDIRDAFVAAAIKLKADGAGTVSGEWAAAMRYFSGGTNTKYRFYGDNVVATAERYEKDIVDLKK